MDADQAKALRARFPARAVGKLPKPYRSDATKGNCQVCGGFHGLPAAHLDYVGHAAVTDRLLEVDPSWSWEPFALDDAGLPSLDRHGNLWIRLTVAGVTRVGVGDGKSLKECIGDAIRNAAMRFGVALDMWAKEDLHALEVERGGQPVEDVPAPEQKPARPTRTMTRKPATTEPVKGMISPAQMRMMHALFNKRDIKDRDARLEQVSNILGRAVESSSELTSHEAASVIDALTAGGASDE